MLHSVSNVIKLFLKHGHCFICQSEDELTNIPANRQVGTCCLPPFISDEDEIWEKIPFVKCLSFWGRNTKLVSVDKLLLSHWADFLRITKFTLRVSLSLCLTIQQISLKIFYRHIWSTLLQSVKFNFFCCFPSLHHNLVSPMCSEERQTLVNTNEQK